jgi:hypothetical protein
MRPEPGTDSRGCYSAQRNFFIDPVLTLRAAWIVKMILTAFPQAGVRRDSSELPAFSFNDE